MREKRNEGKEGDQPLLLPSRRGALYLRVKKKRKCLKEVM